MPVESDMAAGFALAAAIARDRGAERARPGLTGTAMDGLLALPQALGRLGAEERHRRIAGLARRWRAPDCCPPSDANPRALALLATEVDAGTRRAWITDGGPVRPGYAPDPELRAAMWALCNRRAPWRG